MFIQLKHGVLLARSAVQNFKNLTFLSTSVACHYAMLFTATNTTTRSTQFSLFVPNLYIQAHLKLRVCFTPQQ
jgi:hypothetical protein